MKKSIKIISILLLLQLVLGGQLYSQSTDRVRSELVKLELYMMKVWELVKKFDDQKAIEYMTLAKYEIDQARNFLNIERPQVAAAVIHMAKAKQYTDLAARLVLSKPFLNLKSQLDDLVNQAEIVVSTSNSDEARYLLNQSKKFRRLAYDAFKASRIRRGEEYYRIAFFFAKKSVDYLKSSRVDLSGQYEDLLLSVRQLLAQASDLVINTDQKQFTNLLSEAESHFEEANVMASEGKIQMAITRLQLIKRLLYRIYDQAEKGIMTDAERLQNHIYTLRALLESMDQEVQSSRRPRVRDLLENAWKYYRNAENAYEKGDYTQSNNYISISQRFANKVFRMTKTQQLPADDAIAIQLQETRNLLDLQQERVRQSPDQIIITLYEEAGNLLNRAQDAMNSGHNIIAYQLIQAATRMSARVQRELRQESSLPDKMMLDRKYQQVINTLINLEGDQENAATIKPLLEQIKRFADEGKKNIDKGNIILADEYLSTAWEQINQLTDRLRR